MVEGAPLALNLVFDTLEIVLINPYHDDLDRSP